jgi:hypothetical protein
MALRDVLPWNLGPPVLRRLGRNFLIASFASAISAIAMVILRDPLSIPREPWGRYGPLFISLLPLFVFLPWASWHSRRLRRDFAANKGRLCIHCAYIVGPLGERGTCPECGHAFDANADAARWEAAGYTWSE